MKVEPSYHPLYGTSGRGVPYRRGARRNPLFCQGYRGDRNQNGSHISDGIEDKSDPSVRFFYYLGIFVSYHDPNEIFTLRCHRPDRLFPAPGPNPGRQSAGRRVLSLSERLRRALQPDDRHRFVALLPSDPKYGRPVPGRHGLQILIRGLQPPRRTVPARPDVAERHPAAVALHSVDECLVSPKVRRADERMAFTDDSGRRIPNLRRATAPGAQCGTPILRPQLPDGAPPDHRRKPRPELGPCGDRTGPHGTGPLCRRRIQQFAECSDTSIQKIRRQASLLVADRRTGFDAKPAHLIDPGSLRPDGKSPLQPFVGLSGRKSAQRAHPTRSGSSGRSRIPDPPDGCDFARSDLHGGNGHQALQFAGMVRRSEPDAGLLPLDARLPDGPRNPARNGKYLAGERCPLHPNRLGRILPAKQKQQGRQRDLSHGGPCRAHRQYPTPRGRRYPNQRTTDGTLRHPSGPDGLPVL